MLRSTSPHHLSYMIKEVLYGMDTSETATNRTGSLVSVNDVIAGRSSRMNSKMFRAVPSAQVQTLQR